MGRERSEVWEEKWWKQEGSTLTVDGTAYKVEGSLIVLTIDEEDYDITIKLAEKKAE